MKKVFFLVLFFYSFNVYSLSDLYISKKDIDTLEYITDCDFKLLDSSDNVVDSWVCSDNVKYVSNISNGFYKLVSRPLVNDVFSDELSDEYSFYVKDNVLEMTFYNNKIGVPSNLSLNNYNYIGIIIVIFGFIICWYFYKA